ncbi:hypothetical protein ROBYS_00400 [Roseobacter sp. OBYS 0001]|nr:hypothetical protein ROBYS_00400 [Roseobacter sp. OBYS 0001]
MALNIVVQDYFQKGSPNQYNAACSACGVFGIGFVKHSDELRNVSRWQFLLQLRFNEVLLQGWIVEIGNRAELAIYALLEYFSSMYFAVIWVRCKRQLAFTVIQLNEAVDR